MAKLSPKVEYMSSLCWVELFDTKYYVESKLICVYDCKFEENC